MCAELNIQKFLQDHPDDWEQLLAGAPYFVTTKHDGPYFLLKYSQLNSDFSNPIVRECRGIIFHKTDGLVCLPFTKFFNYGEPNAVDIDWSTATVSEKIDGSLCKVWYHYGWHLSTSNTINAFTTVIGDKNETYGDIFVNASGVPFDEFCSNLDRTCVYMFELVSPQTRVVIPYSQPAIYHLATRDMTTLEEIDADVGVTKPARFPFRSVDDVLTAAKRLDSDHEGFVVCDSHYRRLKIKGDEYLTAAHMNNNGVLTNKRILRMWQNDQLDDFVAYIPMYADKVNVVTGALKQFGEDADRLLEKALRECPTRRDCAEMCARTLYQSYVCRRYGGQELSSDSYLHECSMNFLRKVVDFYTNGGKETETATCP